MTARRITIKDRVIKLLRKGKPMLSMDMATELNITKGAASEAAKELHAAKLIHVAEWVSNAKNGGNKVYAYGEGTDAIKPEPRFTPRNKKQVIEIPKTFVPTTAAWWLINPTQGNENEPRKDITQP